MEFFLSHPKIHLGCAALLFDIIIFAFTHIHSYGEPRSRRFRTLVTMVTLATVLEIFRTVVRNLLAPNGPVLFLNIVHSLCYVSSSGIGYAYTLYLSSFYNDESKFSRVYRGVSTVAYILYMFFMIVNVSSGVVSWYTPDFVWVPGPLYLSVGYGVPLLFLLSAVVVFGIEFRGQNRRSKVIMIVTLLLASSAVIIQAMLHGELMIATIGMSACIFLWYLGVESSDYIRLLNTTRMLEESRMDSEQANNAKSVFLANMSHEIRTPLNAVLGLDEMILKSDDMEEIKECAHSIQTSGKALLSIVNDILDFSKIEAGKLKLEETSYHLGHLLEDIRVQYSERAKKNGLEFMLDVNRELPDMICGDVVHLRKIVSNLLDNAIKFTREGLVSLTVDGKVIGDLLMLHIDVKDTGVGIRAEDMPHLFSSFERFDERMNRSIPGSGLGLAIVQRLVTLMDGTIDVESTYGVGSIFAVVVPQKIVNGSPISECTDEGCNTSEKKGALKFYAPEAKVLLVDDNKMNLIVASGFLSKTKAKITTCESGSECLELLKKQKFDIIFLDHMMPTMDGVETLRASRELEGNQNRFTPIIALTANAVTGVRDFYLSKGFTDYISKPIDSNNLYDVFFACISPELKVPADSHGHEQNRAVEDSVNRRDKAVLIDQSAGVEHSGGDRDLYLQLLQAFCAEKDDNQKKLVKYLMEEDWKNYGILSHALKSNGAVVGCDEFSKLARSLEMACKDIEAGKDFDTNAAYVRQTHGTFIQMYNNLAEEASKIH
ncbi:MAG TPA: hypothetical protein DCZ74_07700 [Treponema sp.]|nr:hypothetical protein [Treponema sp.]